VIVTENLTKFYGKLKALDDLTINVKKGVTGFLGPNAAGKTTTIKILMGMLKPTKGRALVLGIDPTKKPIEVKKKVGFLPENPKPYRGMSGFEFLNFIAKLRGLRDRRERERQVSELLQKVGLYDRAKDKISTYSRGMIQRLAIAQALIGDPQLILLDEPTAGLDPLGREEVISLITELKKSGKSLFISSHILSEIERVCERVLIIDRGQLVLDGNVEEIKSQFSSGRYKVKVDKPDLLLKELSQKHFVKETWLEEGYVLVLPTDESEFRKSVLEISIMLGCEVFSLEKERPSLQEVFVSLIRKRGGEIK